MHYSVDGFQTESTLIPNDIGLFPPSRQVPYQTLPLSVLRYHSSCSMVSRRQPSLTAWSLTQTARSPAFQMLVHPVDKSAAAAAHNTILLLRRPLRRSICVASLFMRHSPNSIRKGHSEFLPCWHLPLRILGLRTILLKDSSAPIFSVQLAIDLPLGGLPAQSSAVGLFAQPLLWGLNREHLWRLGHCPFTCATGIREPGIDFRLVDHTPC